MMKLMQRIAITLVCVANAGCASMAGTFTDPVYEDRVAAQEYCLQSALCRTFINDRPAWTEKYVSDRFRCTAHSSEIAKQAKDDGLDTYFLVGRLRGEFHSVAVVVGKDGKEYAYDNGRISSAPFPKEELSHWLSDIYQTDHLPEA